MTDWPALLRDHGPLVWRTAYRLLGREADAADCYQQTFLAAVELERHEPIRHWPATLKRIAAARALDRLRERYRQAARSGDMPADQADVRMADPVDLAQAGELAERLRIALTEIDPRQAEAFCLIALDGHSYDEAAAALSTNANHAGVLLTRAKTALCEKLIAFAPATSGGRQ
jgi:RNA polymerase sigma factor (sigma-70 family)